MTSHQPWRAKVRDILRDGAVSIGSLSRRLERTSGWVRIVHYHHVSGNERGGLSRQLDYLRNYGDFLSLDEVVSLLEAGDPIKGCYFCITFDDGFKSCVTGALPVLVEKRVVAAFFVPTKYVGGSEVEDGKVYAEFLGQGPPEPFLSWDDCRQLVGAGMIVGSHSHSHANLRLLDGQGVTEELRLSKEKIERELGRRCDHFACPFGIPGVHCGVDREPVVARELGYRSFLTAQRGPVRHGESPYWLRRDHLIARWGNYQLRYFLSR